MATTVTPAPGTEAHVIVGSDSDKNQIFAVIGVLVCLCCLCYCCLSSCSSISSILAEMQRKAKCTTDADCTNPKLPYCDTTTNKCLAIDTEEEEEEE